MPASNKITEGNDTFVFNSDSLEIKNIDGEEFIEAYMTTGDKDLVNDIVTREGMADMLSQLKDRTVKIDIEHEAVRGKDSTDTELNKTIIPAGKIVDAELDTKGVKIRIKNNPDYKKFNSKGDIVLSAKEVKNNIKNGFYDALSIAYIPIKDKVVKMKEDTVRLLDKVNLINVAYTGNPVNPSAGITDIMLKSLDYLSDIEIKEANGMKEKVKASTIEAKDEVKASEDVTKLQEEIKSLKKELKELTEKPVEKAQAEKPKQPAGEGPDEEEEVKKKKKKIKKKSETKSGEISQKALDDIEILKKEFAEIKAVLLKPLYKAHTTSLKSAEMKAQRETESNGPLSQIN